MKAGGGKQKGSAFEREVCKRLGLWITEGASEDVFWRSAMSGGRSTLLARKGKEAARQAGDICAVAPEGHVLTDKFFVECKFYRDLSILSFLFGKQRGALHNFWQTAKEQAAKHRKNPMLIAKQNLEQTIVLVDGDVRGALKRWQLVPPDPIAYIITEDVYVYWFDDLFPKPKPRIGHGRAFRK